MILMVVVAAVVAVASATAAVEGELRGAPAWAAVTLRTRPSMIIRVTIERRDMMWFVSFLLACKVWFDKSGKWVASSLRVAG